MNSIIYSEIHAGQIKKKSHKKANDVFIVLFISFLIPYKQGISCTIYRICFPF